VTYLVLRQVEDQLVMPIIVGRAVHVHPLVTIFAVLAGEKIAGVLGMILAVPVAATVKVVLDYAYPRTEEPAGQTVQAKPALQRGQSHAEG
jgi:predicted PurR-regulated permease PerM